MKNDQLAELLARGLVTCDSFAALRQMITPPSRLRAPLRPVGRWTFLRPAAVLAPATDSTVRTPPLPEDLQELIARQLLRRTGVVFRKTVAREKLPITWLSLTRMYRRMELRGEVRGGRFVAGFSGEQYALPDAIELMRHLRRHPQIPASARRNGRSGRGSVAPGQRTARRPPRGPVEPPRRRSEVVPPAPPTPHPLEIGAPGRARPGPGGSGCTWSGNWASCTPTTRWPR